MVTGYSSTSGSKLTSITSWGSILPVRRGITYFLLTAASSSLMTFLMFSSLERISSSSAISPSSLAMSLVRLRMYSSLMLRSLSSATNSAWVSSISKPRIRLGTTSASSLVPRMMAMALSMSSKIASRPCSRCRRSDFLPRSKLMRRRVDSIRHLTHSCRIWRTPITRG